MNNFHFVQRCNYKGLSVNFIQGLESMFQDYSSNILLISDGAECIFISRKAFIRESNPQVLERVSQVVCLKLVLFLPYNYVCNYDNGMVKYRIAALESDTRN